MTTKRTISVYSVLTLLSILPTYFINPTSGVKLSRLENFDTCGGEFSGYQYSITSPNYPHNYSENQDCVYKLHGSPFAKCDQIFHIQFLNFTLRSSKNCELDYLTIEDRSIFCGSVAGVRSYPSKNNTLTIRFHSDSGSDKGFKILITTLPCSNFQNQLTTQSPESVTKHPNIDYEKVYPVYRPNNVFTSEDVKPNKQLSSDSSKINNDQNNYFESSPKITAYFYEPPNFDSEPLDSFAKLSENNKSNNNNVSLKPSTEILLPKSESAYYSNIQNLTSTKTKLIKSKSTNVVDNKSRNNEKLIVVYNSYGVPAGKPYAPLPGYSPAQIQTGEVSENERYNIDCDGKINIPTRIPLPEQTFDDPPVFDINYPSSVALPGINSYPATTYGAPGSPIPPPPAYNPPFIPSDNDYNNNENNNGLVDPLLIPPRPNFDGNINFNNNNNFIPSPNIESSPEFRQCCDNQYNFQKFLIVSPGFPSLSDSANYYDCFYKINPLPNACRLRLNFKYFNYGNDDPFCSNGYVEIDGRKYCGCKTGLSLVTKVINCTPKLIRVRYSGYPRTKFSGFVIEVTQELSPAYNYPYLSRSKKSAENLTKTEILNITAENSAAGRVKRELGYSYPKPNIVFNDRIPNHGGIGNVINGFVSNAACQTLNFVSWTLASKEVNLRGARCFWNNGNGQAPGLIVYPGNVNNGYLPPNNLPGITNPNYPSSNPNYPSSNPNYPSSNPNYPSSNPNYPSSNPGYLPPIPNYPNINENIDVPPVSVIPNPGLPPTNSPNYPNSGIGIPSGSCKLVSVKEGIISSPFYPSAYQNNLNACYRFVRAPNQCKLQLSILDFDLENSLGCTKDFVIFGNQFTRYCGRSVAGSKTLLNFPRNDIIDIRFVTDSYGTGRGFNIAFTQVLCTVG